MQNYYNYLYTKKLNLDSSEIYRSSNELYNFIINTFHDNGNGYQGNAPTTTKLYNQYNLFLYNLPGFYNLFYSIRDTYKSITKSTEPVYIQSWVNVYNRGDYIDWHGHWPAGMKVWHGFYCVNTEPDSFTSYKLPFLEDIINIKSENDLLVIGKSEDDRHKSSEWNQESPRVTIAFDIVPAKHINPFNEINHWIPL